MKHPAVVRGVVIGIILVTINFLISFTSTAFKMFITHYISYLFLVFFDNHWVRGNLVSRETFIKVLASSIVVCVSIYIVFVTNDWLDYTKSFYTDSLIRLGYGFGRVLNLSKFNNAYFFIAFYIIFTNAFLLSIISATAIAIGKKNKS
jgi:hypothetical protein